MACSATSDGSRVDGLPIVVVNSIHPGWTPNSEYIVSVHNVFECLSQGLVARPKSVLDSETAVSSKSFLLPCQCASISFFPTVIGCQIVLNLKRLSLNNPFSRRTEKWKGNSTLVATIESGLVLKPSQCLSSRMYKGIGDHQKKLLQWDQ